jgi:hypothetical protein
MKQEYVLPKFRIPGQANWLVRGVWFVAGVVTLSLGALGLAYWRRPLPPVPVVAQAPAPAAPVAPAAAKPPVAPAGAVPRPGAPPAAVPGAPAKGNLAAAKRPGTRFGAGRGYRRGWGKGKYAKARGGKRGLAARRAYLRKKRMLAARRGAAGWPAKPAAAAAPLSPQRGRGTTGAPAASKSAKGDPIDDILRNFK